MSARYAIYLAPAPDTRLWRVASAWLGRDAERDCDIAYVGPTGIDVLRADAMTAEARHYGFHATIKAPFRLGAGASVEALCAAADDFAKQRAPFAIDLHVAALGSFLALVERQPSAAIATLHADALAAFEPFRAPLNRAEIDRRLAAGLSEREQAHLATWGYPYVLDAFRLHFTLTGRLPPHEQPEIAALLTEYFAPVIAEPLIVDAICLFEQPEAGLPFRVRYRAPLSATA
ncbi:MAG: DUF1045 domain-containing protein [Sphingomonas sp.]|uniref:DUF1045 domain-containing protein n=1 Tax=Sphingomonas sp. TaxID=28214 RepID=UPI003F30EF5F